MGRLTHHTGPGWTYFITTKAWESKSLFQVEETAQIIVSKLLEYRDKGNYLLHDFVLMPNHLHLILTPAETVSLEKAMQLIKGGSSHEIHAARGSKMPVWQSGFHESRVTCWTDYQNKRDYICFNPVAARLAERPELWMFGSASGRFALDPIPQGLKPIPSGALNVGAKAPTPGAPTGTVISGAEAQEGLGVARGLKPQPPEEKDREAAIPQGPKPIPSGSLNVGAKAPTPGAPTGTVISGAEAQEGPGVARGLKPVGVADVNVGPEGPTPDAHGKAPTPAASAKKAGS